MRRSKRRRLAKLKRAERRHARARADALRVLRDRDDDNAPYVVMAFRVWRWFRATGRAKRRLERRAAQRMRRRGFVV